MTDELNKSLEQSIYEPFENYDFLNHAYLSDRELGLESKKSTWILEEAIWLMFGLKAQQHFLCTELEPGKTLKYIFDIAFNQAMAGDIKGVKADVLSVRKTVITGHPKAWIEWCQAINLDPHPIFLKIFSISSNQLLDTPEAFSLSMSSITEHLNKARDKLSQEDYSGSITNCYTLIEGTLKHIAEKTNTSFKPEEGSIETLYKQVAPSIGLNIPSKNTDSHQNTFLNGLLRQISGLYNLANKAGDRHSQQYKIEQAEAILTVNGTFALCEFLVTKFNLIRRC